MSQKSQQDRLQEVIKMYQRLKDMGVSCDLCPALSEFKIAANTFVKEGFSTTGKIKLPEVNRTLHYHFTMQPHIESTIVLRQ